MKIERQKVGTVEVLSPVGPLVDQDVEAFGQMLQKRIGSSNPRVVVVLHDVPYLDSAALETLLDATDDLSERAMTLKLASVSPTCREILELTNLAGRFSFFTDVEDAVRSYL